MSTIDDMLAEQAKRDNDMAFQTAQAKIRRALLDANGAEHVSLSQDDELKVSALLQPWRAPALARRLDKLRRSLVAAAVEMGGA